MSLFTRALAWFSEGRSPHIEVAASEAVTPPTWTPGAPPPLAPAAEPRPWSSHRPTWRSQRYVQDITPARIASLLQQAHAGRPGEFARLVHELTTRDLHVQAELGKRKRAVLGLPWSITPASTRARDRKIAAFVDEQIRFMRGLEQSLLDLLDAVAQGYAAAEVDWTVEGAVVRPRRLQHRPQWFFAPDDHDPSIWRIFDAKDSVNGVVPPYGRLIVHESHSVSGFGGHTGLGQGLVWFYMFKRFALSDWATYAELFGAPLRIGRYPMGAKPEDIAKLERALAQLGVDAWAVLPQGMDVEFQASKGGGAAGGTDVFERLVAACDRQVSIGVLGQTLTTTEGTSGSRALGQVHNDVRWDLCVSDARELADTLTHQLVEPLVRFNFGADARLPRFGFDVRQPVDEERQAKVRESRLRQFRGAIEMGLEVSQEQVREELGLRPVAPDEPKLGKRLPAAEQLPDMIEQVEKAADHFRESMGQDAWKALVEQITDTLAGLRPGDEVAAFVDLVTAMDLEDLSEALAEATLTADLMGRAHVDNGDRPLRGWPDVPPKEAKEWWVKRKVCTKAEYDRLSAEHRARAFTVSAWHSLDAVQRASDLFADVLGSGGTIDDFEDGLIALGQELASPVQLELVWRNAAASAYNAGRYTRQSSAEARKRRPFLRYHTCQDSHVRATHEAMHGRVWPADHPIWQTWYPPNGHKCRCWCTAHSEAEVKAAGWTIEDELPVRVETGEPLVPDDGFQRNGALEPFEYDFTAFPSEWRDAINQKAT